MGTRPLHVVADARCLNNDHLRGMGRCLWELVRRSTPDVRWTLLSDRRDQPFHTPPNTQAQVQVRIFGLPGYRFRTWEQIALPLAAWAARADVLYCPALSLPWVQRVPTVVALYDAIPWLFDEEGWPAGIYRDRVLPNSYRKCEAIITTSEGSRRDIVALWPELAEKIRVIPLGVDDAYLDAQSVSDGASLAEYGLHGPFILYVGGSNPRKRLSLALSVFARLKSSEVQLAICGVEQRSWAGVTASLPADVRSRVVMLPFVPEQVMPTLYAGALAVVYPTAYEGFGLPALEAQAVGARVVFEPVNGLTELQGPGAMVVRGEEEWVAALDGIVSGRNGCGSSVKQQMREWARGFSWDAYAGRTLSVIRTAAVAGR